MTGPSLGGFGVAALNRALGAPHEGKRYVYQARAGRDQHLLLLQLLRASLADGAPSLVLTDEDPDSLVLFGEAMGLDITQPLAAGRVHITRYARRFADLANLPSHSAALLDAWAEEMHRSRPQRVVFLGWPRALDHDVKLLSVLESLAVEACRARAACFHLVDAADRDRFGHDISRRAFAEVRLQPSDTFVRGDILRGPVPADLAVFDLEIRQGHGFVDAEGPIEAPIHRVDRLRTNQ